MTYDYSCSKCGHIQEEWHGMKERPFVHCNKCRGACVKLIGTGEGGIMGMSGGRATYDFVDFNTTGKPVHIKSKRQWQQHLKSHGLHDDVPNTPIKRDQLKEGMVNVDKAKMKRETREAIVKAVKDKKFKSEIKQKIKKDLYEARNK
jgi:putative FmdB family regulatory protein